MNRITLAVTLTFAFSSGIAAAADRLISSDASCANLPSHAQLQAALAASVTTGAGGSLATGANGGLNFPMWATVVNSSGRVCAIAKLGGTDPWPGSRVISAQKAYTANAFSNEKLALSTANLFSAVQPGGSLYGLQHSNPVNPLFAYAGDSTKFGTKHDPMVGFRVGGINVFGGGLALYNSSKRVIGAIGVSGDTSCADHMIAWRLRAALVGKGAVAGVVPGGVNASGVLAGASSDDNIIFDITANPAGGVGVSANGFGHPTCLGNIAPLAGNVGN